MSSPSSGHCVTKLLDGLIERGGCDLVADYVTPIPATVIAHLLGADPADHPRFALWSDLVVQSTYATKNRRDDGEEGEGLAGVAPEFVAHIDAMIAGRRAAADPPMISSPALSIPRWTVNA